MGGRASPKLLSQAHPHAGGREGCHHRSARWSMVKGSLLSREGNKPEKPSTLTSALSPLGKNEATDSVYNCITLIHRGKIMGAGLAVIYWVVFISNHIWWWLEPKCQFPNCRAVHESVLGAWQVELTVKLVKLRSKSFHCRRDVLWVAALQHPGMRLQGLRFLPLGKATSSYKSHAEHYSLFVFCISMIFMFYHPWLQ